MEDKQTRCHEVCHGNLLITRQITTNTSVAIPDSNTQSP